MDGCSEYGSGAGGAVGAGIAKCDNTLFSFIIIHERPVVTFTAAGFVVGPGDSASSQEASAARLSPVSSSVKWVDNSAVCLML